MTMKKHYFINNLDRLNVNQGDYTKALSSYEEALNIYKNSRPPDDLDLATIYNNIGQVYYNMGDNAKALSYYEQSLEIYQNKLSEDHPSLAIVYNNMGLVYKI